MTQFLTGFGFVYWPRLAGRPSDLPASLIPSPRIKLFILVQPHELRSSVAHTHTHTLTELSPHSISFLLSDALLAGEHTNSKLHVFPGGPAAPVCNLADSRRFLACFSWVRVRVT